MLMWNDSPILLAEPVPEEAMRIRQLLRQMGYRVRVAATGEAALAALREEMLQRAVVAVELAAGDELLLARVSRLPAMETLVAIGPDRPSDLEVRARQAGAQVYLPRPVQAADLVGAFQVWLPVDVNPQPP